QSTRCTNLSAYSRERVYGDFLALFGQQISDAAQKFFVLGYAPTLPCLAARFRRWRRRDLYPFVDNSYFFGRHARFQDAFLHEMGNCHNALRYLITPPRESSARERIRHSSRDRHVSTFLPPSQPRGGQSVWFIGMENIVVLSRK